MFRKTMVATALIGAGLGSMSGAAFAGEAPSDHGHDKGHHSSHDDGGRQSAGPQGGCTNEIAAASENGAGETEGDTTGGDQAFDASNLCNFLNGNEVLNDANIAVGGSSIRNGDNIDETTTITETVTETVTELAG